MIDPTIDYKYISLLGDKLDGFKMIHKDTYNFRCPICGDSERNISKKRGYIYSKEGKFFFYCHNCSSSMSFKKFLQMVSPELYKDYIKDILVNGKISFEKKEEKNIKFPKRILPKYKLKNISELDKNHPAYQYLLSRKVPIENFSKVKWTDDFPKLVKDNIGAKYNETKLPKSGIVFELREMDGTLSGYQIRSIEKDCPKSQRFVICSINDTHGYFFNLNDCKKPVFIVEGCIDALFLTNCIAVLSASLYRIHPINNCIYFNDQEPRNKEVCKQIEKCISKGYKIVLLSSRRFEGMDINDIVKSGMSRNDVEEMFYNNCYSGLTARIKYSQWKK